MMGVIKGLIIWIALVTTFFVGMVAVVWGMGGLIVMLHSHRAASEARYAYVIETQQLCLPLPNEQYMGCVAKRRAQATR